MLSRGSLKRPQKAATLSTRNFPLPVCTTLAWEMMEVRCTLVSVLNRLLVRGCGAIIMMAISPQAGESGFSEKPPQIDRCQPGGRGSTSAS